MEKPSITKPLIFFIVFATISFFLTVLMSRTDIAPPAGIIVVLIFFGLIITTHVFAIKSFSAISQNFSKTYLGIFKKMFLIAIVISGLLLYWGGIFNAFLNNYNHGNFIF